MDVKVHELFVELGDLLQKIMPNLGGLGTQIARDVSGLKGGAELVGIKDQGPLGNNVDYTIS